MADIPRDFSWKGYWAPAGPYGLSIGENSVTTIRVNTIDTIPKRQQIDGPPLGANDLKDYDAGWFLHGPLSSRKWDWFIAQLRGFIWGGQYAGIPLTHVFPYKHGVYGELRESYFQWLVDPIGKLRTPGFFEDLNTLIKICDPNFNYRYDPLSRPWFEAAIEVFRNGWPYTRTTTEVRTLGWDFTSQASFSVVGVINGIQTNHYYVNLYKYHTSRDDIPAGYEFKPVSAAATCAGHEWSGSVVFNIPENWATHIVEDTVNLTLVGPTRTKTGISPPVNSVTDTVSCALIGIRHTTGSVASRGVTINHYFTPVVKTFAIERV